MLCLPVLLLTASLAWAVNSLWLYQYGSQKYGVSQTLANSGLELTDSELVKVYAGLISYFNSGEEYISLNVIKDGEPFNLFTPEETIHFSDVKGLIRLDYSVLLGTLVYALAYAGVSLFWRKRRYWRQLALGAVVGSGITLAVMLTLALGVVFDFGPMFYQFHLLFFPNIYWSAEGFMLQLFPEDFFRDAAIFCALATTIGAVVLGGVGRWYLFLSRSVDTPL
jgi:integral membrane protein (TIGR01906 family)